MKILERIYIPILLVTFLLSCNLPDGAGVSTQTTNQDRFGTFTAVTLQVNPTRTLMPITTPILMTPVMTSTPIPIPPLPDTPAWSAYDYVCELAAGGSTMKMNLAWFDRSESEDGYKVYRDGKVIATLAPNSTFYADVAFVAAGKVLSYSIEAFNVDWKTSTSTIAYGCQ